MRKYFGWHCTSVLQLSCSCGTQQPVLLGLTIPPQQSPKMNYSFMHFLCSVFPCLKHVQPIVYPFRLPPKKVATMLVKSGDFTLASTAMLF